MVTKQLDQSHWICQRMKCKFFAHSKIVKQKFIAFSSFDFYRAAQLAKGMLAISIFITHGLNCYVAIDITWTEYIKKRLNKSSPKLFYEYIVRTVLVLITCKTIIAWDTHPGNRAQYLFPFYFLFSISFTGCGYSKSWTVHIIDWSIVFVCPWAGLPSGKPKLSILKYMFSIWVHF